MGCQSRWPGLGRLPVWQRGIGGRFGFILRGVVSFCGFAGFSTGWMMAVVDDWLKRGLACHQAGQVGEAEGFYQQILEKEPGHAEALYLLGTVAGQRGVGGRAAELIRRAIAARPVGGGEGRYYNNLGIAAPSGWGRLMRRSGRIESAARAETPEALSNLGNLLAVKGHAEEAAAFCRRAVALRPGYAEAHYNLGLALEGLRKVREAKGAYEQAAALQPRLMDAQFRLGVVSRELGNWARAQACFESVIAGRPGFIEAYSYLGVLLRQTGRIAEGLAVFEKGLAAEGGGRHAGLLNNYGEALFAVNRVDEAIAAYRRALAAMEGEHAEILNNLAATLNMTGDLDEAVAISERAVRADPRHAGAWSNLGSGQKGRGELDAAIAAYRKAVEIKPDPVWHSNLLYALHFHPDVDAEILLKEHREWDRMYAGQFSSGIVPHENVRDGGRRLRVGYVSPDFRNHPVGRFMAGPLEKHDREAVEVFCYSDVIVPDAVTGRIQAAVDRWRNIQGISDEEIARMIRRDRIDVLVDLTMHMNRNRMLVFARKPAPVQVTYLAYCSTTGLSAMDWRITDAQIDPAGGAGTDGFYTEKSWRLPGSYWCYEAPAEAPDVGEMPALKNGFVTFGCLNHFSKVSTPALLAWRELLLTVPGSRLILHAHPGRHRERIAAFFGERGVAAERIELVALQAMPAYLATYRRIDVGLDPFPYAGGTTTCDALWMGVPVVTLRGRTAVGRGGASLLTNLGLGELVTGTREEYAGIAAGLARDVPRLRELRAGMRERMRASVLMDPEALAGGLEKGFRATWHAS